MATSNDVTELARPRTSRRMIQLEILIVLLVTFGMSGLRSLLRLIDAYLQPVALNEQQVVINKPQSDHLFLELTLQFTSALSLISWGLLAWFLLVQAGHALGRFRLGDVWRGCVLAAVIGIPGIGLYAVALHFGWTKQVVVSALVLPWLKYPLLILWAAANAFAEEVVVVAYLTKRLNAVGVSDRWAIVASSVLRGSYHLYQGVSAGFGNLVMGLVFSTYYVRKGRIWPLVAAHLIMDVVAFLGPVLLAGRLGFIGM